MSTDNNPIGRGYRRRLVRRRLHELIGTYKHSKPGLNGLDVRLAQHLTKAMGNRPGFFIECGANDGYEQSNTFYLARRYKWSGILIEPIPELAEHCASIRPESTVVRCALGEPEAEGTTIQIQRAGLMSSVHGALGESEEAHFERAQKLQKDLLGDPIEAQVRTLSAVLDEHASGRTADLLSLDVEGYEPQALRGLDLTRHAPRFICVEANDPDAIHAILAPRYELAAQLSHHDRLYERRDS